MTFDRMGLRGVAHETVTWDLVFRYAHTAGRRLACDRAAVGRDPRTTGELFVHAATAGLLRAGLDVDVLGVVPTPALQHYVGTTTDIGLQITASHNPPEYNGLKAVGSDGSVLPLDTTRSLQEAVRDGDSPDETAESRHRETSTGSSADSTGSSRRVENVPQSYVESILERVHAEGIRDRNPTVVLDPGNGAGGLTSPTLLRRLGCQVSTLNAEPDGTFPARSPEPTVESLTGLRELVRARDADVGIAHDGDADRTVFVDETGTFIDGNAAFAALTRAAVKPGQTVVTPVNASQRVVDAVADAGAELTYTQIGNAHILDRIRGLSTEGVSVAIAGEGNGGVIYPQHRLGRDGGYTAAAFLQLLTDGTASDVVEPHRGYHFERRNIPYSDETEREAIMERAAEWAERADGDTTSIDGYRVDFGEKWALVRPSGTEPYVRIYAESPSETETSSLLSAVEERVA